MSLGLNRRSVCLILWLCLAPACSPPLAAQQVSEYQVKAAYLYQFLNFVEWPERAFRDAAAPYQVCVLGSDPFGSDLDAMVQGKQVRGRGVRLQRLNDPAAAHLCHVLFIAASERKRLPSILGEVSGHPLLTVSELPGFEQQGGMIRFVVEQQSVRLRINPETSAAAGLQISSKLLAVATIVHGREGGGLP